ncbi:TetR/AcrR family transcriptional regulator [Pseudonocardia spinosispora]|uniref:TetR/AcrR family transcriptional regulator n=1 Tax=Pseudonocardia spinosispora TaxID=103441 RepID=UPI0003FB40F8|nr:TetR/AcrR family transcriptional regulator [Pseudonocardia spinosispora]
MPEKSRPLRADAARNRARVLEVAYETFAEEGLAVPIDEIARRAGVGAGTLYRHFPTKEALYGAVVVDRIRRFTERANELADGDEPGAALREFFAELVEAASNQGLVEAMSGSGFDVAISAPDEEKAFLDALQRLLTAAQRSGEIRADIDVRHVKALMVGCQAMQRYATDPDVPRQLLAVVWSGLRSP